MSSTGACQATCTLPAPLRGGPTVVAGKTFLACCRFGASGIFFLLWPRHGVQPAVGVPFYGCNDPSRKCNRLRRLGTEMISTFHTDHILIAYRPQLSDKSDQRFQLYLAYRTQVSPRCAAPSLAARQLVRHRVLVDIAVGPDCHRCIDVPWSRSRQSPARGRQRHLTTISEAAASM